MSQIVLISTVLVYFVLLYAVSRFVGGKGDNDAFFRANRQSSWWVVAFGMIGASVSGVSFVSVTGMVGATDMTYMQMCIGFFVGYILVAVVLLPLYYKLRLTSIYTYLKIRFGTHAYRTGAVFFILSKLLGASIRLFLVCRILHDYVFAGMGIPFEVTAIATVVLIWCYTHRSGVKTLVWTDALQTLCLIVALTLIAWQLCALNGLSLSEAVTRVTVSEHAKWFEWEDWSSRQHFVKQFLSGIFIVVVMTGLDQDMMQKNLTCKTLRDAQKDLCSYGFFFIPLNWLFLSVGILLLMFAQRHGISVPTDGDDILPYFCAEGYLGTTVMVLFAIGVIAAAFSSADSAMTALTTSVCIDLLDVENGQRSSEKTRKRVHFLIAIMFACFILFFQMADSRSALDAIYVAASYTYGPLLGMFAFGMFTTRMPNDRFIPAICIVSPLLCYVVEKLLYMRFGYEVGYELLMCNAVLTFLMLLCVSKRKTLIKN